MKRPTFNDLPRSLESAETHRFRRLAPLMALALLLGIHGPETAGPVRAQTSSPNASEPPQTSSAESTVQTAPMENVGDPEDALVALFEGCFDDYLELNPGFASQIGQRNDRLTLDLSEDYRRRLGALYRRCLDDLERFDLEGPGATALSPTRLEQARAYHRVLSLGLEGLSFPSHLLPLVPGWSLDNRFPQLASGDGAHPFRTVEDYDDFLSRMRDFESWVDLAITNLRTGLERGVIHPREIVAASLPELARHARTPFEESPFHQPIRNLPDDFPATEKERLTAAYAAAFPRHVQAPYRRLAEFLNREYLPRARVGISLAELPGGDAWYRHLARFYTTTELDPDAIFELGEREVERIRREMNQLRRRQGFQGSLREFERALQSSRQAAIPRGRVVSTFEAIGRRVEKALPRVVGLRPQAPYEIREVEPYRQGSAGGAFYERPRPSLDTEDEVEGRPGIFYVNLRGAYYPRYTMETLFLHEALPGHHLQLALAQEMEDLPRFQRYGYFGAYVEGWGLYCEGLGRELGLYGDPLQRYGQLTYDLCRAGRLIADVGIHHKGWDRAEAERELSRRGLSWALGEIQRYASIPGQALGYKIGELRIRALRDEAETILGRRFDLPAFHDMILSGGPLPLDVLEQRARRWIAEQPR